MAASFLLYGWFGELGRRVSWEARKFGNPRGILVWSYGGVWFWQTVAKPEDDGLLKGVMK